MTLRYDPATRDILSPDNMIVATVSGIFNRADPGLGHQMAAAKEMVEALTAVMEGCHYGVLGEDTQPQWHSIRMPTREVMDKVRAALERATP